MRGRDNNRINMIGTVIEYCEKNTAATSAISAFPSVLSKIKTKKAKIDELSQKDNVTTKGVTKDTVNTRTKMSELAFKCSSATLAYANSVKNFTLAAQVRIIEDEFRVMSKENALTKCQAIHDAANANIAEVVNYGLTAGDVTDLQAAINKYRADMTNPRQARIKKSGANRQIKELVREILDKLLKLQLDPMVDTLRFSNSYFWKGYRLSRNIINLGVTHAKVRGTVRDENDNPLVGVRFTITDAETNKIIAEVMSDSKSVFNAPRLPAGTFNFKWELNGYVTKTEESVRVALGKSVRRRVVLKM